MRLERINENQIRCTLNQSDLADRNLFLNELAYSTEKTKDLFRDMMQRAFYELGFDAEDIPLMIEAIPVSSESLVLVITKVEDPEELDTRFSKFSKPHILDIEIEDMAENREDREEFSNIYESFEGSHTESSMGEEFSILPRYFSPDSYDESLDDDLPSQKVFCFHELDSIIMISSLLHNVYHEPSQLYKDEKKHLYYLILQRGNLRMNDFQRICNLISEYGDSIPLNYASTLYFKEHFTNIAGNDALNTLAKL